MQCTQFETRVHELLDSRQRPQDDPRLQQHAADCQDCSQFMLGQHMMLDGLSASLPSVESGSLQDVLQPEFDRLSASPVTLQHQPSFPTRRLTALLAIAASLLLVAWLLIPSGSDPVDSQLTLKPTPADSEVQSEQSQPDDIQLPDPIREFLAWDPSNTYEKASLVHPVLGASYRETTGGTVNIYTAADDAELQVQGFAHKKWALVMDTVAEDVSYDDVTLPYTISNGLTSHIILFSGLAIQMRFPTMLSEHNVIYDYATPVNMDWETLLTRIEDAPVTWKDPEFQKIWSEHWVWTERLAAFTFNALETSEHGG